MIRTRNEACNILGISPWATEAEIKTTYKTLVKAYHPDANKAVDVSKYNQIVEAYDFLCREMKATYTVDSNRVIGVAKHNSSTNRGVSSRGDYDAFQKKMKKQKEEKRAAFEQMTKEYSAQIEKQEADYKRAMAAIDAIRAARAIEAMVWANGMEKDGKNKE